MEIEEPDRVDGRKMREQKKEKTEEAERGFHLGVTAEEENEGDGMTG